MRLDDGFSTIIEIDGLTSAKFYEKTVQPPGLDGGDPINTTTMRNVAWRTFAPKALKTLSEMKVTVAYDPAFFGTTQALAILNVNKEITITFPDGSTLVFWGYLAKFEPDDLQEGEQGEADMTIQPTNVNSSGVETAPVYAAAA